MNEPCGHDERCERQQQEYEFIMEGITTRMQTAMEKMATTVKYVCVVMLMVIIIVVAGFIAQNQLWFGHMNAVRESMRSEVVTSANEAIPESGSGAHDR